MQPEDEAYYGFDLQKQLERYTFCSVSCLKSWIVSKIITMCLTILLGLILLIILTVDGEFTVGLILFFVPPIIRQCASSLAELFEDSDVGAFLSFALVLLGSITIVYPVYMIIRETIYYIKTLKMIKLYENQ